MIAREAVQLRDLIAITKTVLLEQRKFSFSSHLYRNRKYIEQTARTQSLFLNQAMFTAMRIYFSHFSIFIKEQQNNDDCGISPMQNQTQLKESELQQWSK